MAQMTDSLARAILNGGGYTRHEVEQLCHAWLAQASDTGREPVAWLHTVTQGDGSETDLALSFAPDNFPLAGELGFRSLGAVPLYTHTPASEDSAGKDGEPARYFVSGPHGEFWTNDREFAETLLRDASHDREEWTITDLHAPTGEAR